ncbi:Succinate--CoA ligase [ADP-forming] subunit beta [Candidatus Rhabdochlamydia oedothoracis]|uniref:Succinate--CoA ligase [ADP-forming] subunit beta n=1 Tax=Candidatus Rhabdochlamydia oedothoracis TaxID=2720720 RepID=A0ABX8V2L3_9BACT|nr:MULTISPECIES: ADP-forming succinate--CoA ligase subunit beta [Rhabdochlamydia]KAG6559409.1 Succinate--CoA ligase [ADP-forming] subunit beta [Candidatus Rhabdochlamydia sp. W815]MCL6756411.1 ADP-forming succinate--CoA ligase subunit beta [Candidatus Rhabdochlamydia oedothoracis]QYF49096.1 Succinate--CoA ligase [ADP-forming] subunit beta [Candidatus Rhabdochlamydia oedothoracis]
MNTHEYQAKEILISYKIPIPRFGIASSIEGVEAVLRDLSLEEAVIKIQVHAGGRGKAGGVKIAHGRQEILKTTRKLIGMKMVNNQTGSQGVIAHQVLISEVVAIKKEYYLSVVIDREKKQVVLIASAEGGVEIEEIALKNPEKVLTIPIGLSGVLRPFQKIQLIKFMQWKAEMAKQGAQIAQSLVQAFMDTDASLLEINPLVADQNHQLWALDAKLVVDDNALFRQQKIADFYDPSQAIPNEVKAKEHDLAYIALEGNIGCMVNGAGLAMATMDIIQYYGGKPANFLDVGGGASKEKVAEGFKIILSDPNVKAILVNIFGGIMNCATLAEGIIAAVKEIKIHVPLVVRMEGTNVEEGRRLLEHAHLAIITVDGLANAAKKVVETLKGKE